MKNYFVTAILVFCCSVVFAQTNKDEAEVRKLNEQLDNAIKNNDVAFFEKTLAADYVSLRADGSIKSRNEALEEARSQKANPTYRISDLGSEDVKVKHSGNLAVVTAKWNTTSHSMEDDEPHKDTGHYIAVYEKNKGQWQLVSEMGSETPHTPEELEPAIRKASEKYDEALKNRDREALADMLADDFSSIGPDGKVRNKEENLAMIFNPDLKIEDGSSEDKKFRVYRNFAVETGKYNIKGNYKGEQFSESGRYTSTWMLKDGKWQIVADHVSGAD